ncbi:hypothetical protein AGMMS49938_00720 [Fibrobacterales bacterium]|nr:hypothetical protein AGMMS49938_00720 [Fibrobacterales bacterium]
MLILFLIILPFIIVIGAIVFFNVYVRKQITKDTTPPPELDTAYIKAENTGEEDSDLGNVFN